MMNIETVYSKVDAITAEDVAGILKTLNARISSDREVLVKFAADMKKDPVHALSWSDNVFDAAASNQLMETLVADIGRRGAGVLKEYVKSAVNQAIRSAMSPTHSTSMTSNRMAVAEAKAYADLLDLLYWF